MAVTANATADHPARRDRSNVTENFHGSGLVSFLTAGAVLFASLVVGSSASLVVVGGNDLIAAILEGFLELGLWALGWFLVAVALAVAMSRHRG